MIEWLITALGLILVFEGLTYAIFPKQMKKILSKFLEYSDATAVMIGLPLAALGLFLIWMVR